MDLVKDIKLKVDKHFDDFVEIRRHLHAHPELSFEEKETSAYICRQLDSHGIKYTTVEIWMPYLSTKKTKSPISLLYLA